MHSIFVRLGAFSTFFEKKGGKCKILGAHINATTVTRRDVHYKGIFSLASIPETGKVLY